MRVSRVPRILFIAFCLVWIMSAHADNHVLSLNGDGSYVEIINNDGLNAITTQVTVEAWIKPTAFTNSWMPLIYKGDGYNKRSYSLWLDDSGLFGLYSAASPNERVSFVSPSGLIAKNRWYHIAGVIDAHRGVMKLFINGIQVAQKPFAKTIYVSELPLRIGWTHESQGDYSPFAGQIDEVRVWNVARTQAEIIAALHAPLSGVESGLVGYWNFEGDGEKAIDATGGGHDGRFIRKTSNLPVQNSGLRVPGELPTSVEQPALVEGVVQDKTGKPLGNANLRLARGYETIAETQTDTQGRYVIATWTQGKYDSASRESPLRFDLYATTDTFGDLREGIELHKGKRLKTNFTLKAAMNISGTLLMLDNKTPHVGVSVQAVTASPDANSEPIVAATTLSDEGGRYQFINFKQGQYRVRCYTGNRYVYYGDNASADDGKVLQVERNKTLKNIDFHIPPVKKGIWKHFTTLDGLVDNAVWSVHQDNDGVMWFGTERGVSKYDGKGFTTFTEKDGLADNNVYTIHQDADGVMWFGSGEVDWLSGGVSRYDGGNFVIVTKEHGLVPAIHSDPDGIMWFASWGIFPSGGVTRYDGREFVTFTAKDGLTSNRVIAICRALDGTMWFGTGSSGVFRYDGETFVNFTKADALAGNTVLTIHAGTDGALWFGTSGGVS